MCLLQGLGKCHEQQDTYADDDEQNWNVSEYLLEQMSSLTLEDLHGPRLSLVK